MYRAILMAMFGVSGRYVNPSFEWETLYLYIQDNQTNIVVFHQF